MPLYVRRLPGTRSRLIDKAASKNLVCFNPSKAGPYVYIRATEHDALYETNHILIYDETSKTLKRVPYAAAGLLVPTVNLFKGLEDLRLCMWDGRLWFTATTTHASNHMTNEMLLGRFTAGVDAVEFLQIIDVGGRPAKNVCPFVTENSLHLLDMFKSCIYKCVRAEGREHEQAQPEQWTLECVRTLEWHAGEPDFYRGSTSPVHLHGSTWGCVAHDIIFNDNTQLVTRLSYLHHWIEFDIARGAVTFVSSPFWVAHWGVEYVSGIELDKNKHKITLYLGIMDKEAMACDTTLADLRCGK